MNKLTIIITGCSSGLGKKLLIQLLKKKNIFIIGICRNKLKIKDIYLKNNKKLYLIECDLLKINQVKKLIFNLQKIKNINILINNAGSIFYHNNNIYKNLSKTYFLNFIIPFLLSFKLKENFQKKTKNLILNIGSNACKIYPFNERDVDLNDNDYGFKSYCKSKSALLHITTKLGTLKEGIVSCYVHPGLLRTQITKSVPFLYKQLYKLGVFFFGQESELSAKFIIEKIILKKRIKNYQHFDFNNFTNKKIKLKKELTNKIWVNCLKKIKNF
jgi:short-subunit dehydrogenase